MSPIFILLENRNWAGVRELAAEGPFIDRFIISLIILLYDHILEASAIDAYGMTPLHHAAGMNAPLDIATLIIDSNPAAAKTQDNDGRLPLHYACDYQADFGIVKALVDCYIEGCYFPHTHSCIRS
jgi:ankyrin repeat protein